MSIFTKKNTTQFAASFLAGTTRGTSTYLGLAKAAVEHVELGVETVVSLAANKIIKDQEFKDTFSTAYRESNALGEEFTQVIRPKSHSEAVNNQRSTSFNSAFAV